MSAPMTMRTPKHVYQAARRRSTAVTTDLHMIFPSFFFKTEDIFMANDGCRKTVYRHPGSRLFMLASSEQTLIESLCRWHKVARRRADHQVLLYRP